MKKIYLLFMLLMSVSIMFASEGAEIIDKVSAEKVSKSEVETKKVDTGNENKKLSRKEFRKLKKAKIKELKKSLKNVAGEDKSIAIILGLISVILLPFAFHNWYLGKKKKALWQTLMVFPGLILILPAIASWIWQLIDLVVIIAE